MGRALSNTGRMLNHVELIYAPGDRKPVKRLFEALGCKVIDPQDGPIPEDLGPGVLPYLVIYLDPESDDPFDNVMYASEVTTVQWEFEQQLRGQLEQNPELAAAQRALAENYPLMPQAMTHIGLAFPSAAAVVESLERIEKAPELRDRVRISKVFRPGEPDSADDRVVQAFVHTHLCSVGLLAIGQQLELQVRLDL